jgi:hypothetical protein
MLGLVVQVLNSYANSYCSYTKSYTDAIDRTIVCNKLYTLHVSFRVVHHTLHWRSNAYMQFELCMAAHHTHYRC